MTILNCFEITFNVLEPSIEDLKSLPTVVASTDLTIKDMPGEDLPSKNLASGNRPKTEKKNNNIIIIYFPFDNNH